jgi:hypothetical protein
VILKYDIAIVGEKRVRQALAGIETRFVQHNAKMNRIAGTPARAGSSRAAGGEAKIQVDALARSRAKAEGHVAGVRRRYFAQQQREEERSIARTTRERARAEAHVAGVRRRYFVQQQREEAQRVRAEASARNSYRRATIGTAANSVRGTTRAIGTMGASALAIGGGFAITGALSHAMDRRSAAVELANQAYNTPGETRSREQIASSVSGIADREAIRSGLGSTGITEGMRQFVAIAGSVTAAEKIAPSLADFANATGADIGDVGRTAGQVAQAMIQSRGMSPDEAVADTLKVMQSAAGQAKIGSIEFADLATQMGKMISSTSKFDGEVADLAATMGAIGQLALAGGAASPEEAMTALMRLPSDITKGQKDFKRPGVDVDVFSDKSKTKLRDPVEVIMDTLQKTGGDLTKMQGLFEERSAKAVDVFRVAYVQELEKGASPQTARANVMAGFEKMRGAKMGDAEVKGSASFRVSQQDRQMAIVAEQFSQEVGEQLIPILKELTPKLKEIIPATVEAAKAFAKIAMYLLENPFKGIGAIIATKLAADLASARIGHAVRTALEGGVAGSTSKLVSSLDRAALAAGVFATSFAATESLLRALDPDLAKDKRSLMNPQNLVDDLKVAAPMFKAEMMGSAEAQYKAEQAAAPGSRFKTEIAQHKEAIAATPNVRFMTEEEFAAWKQAASDQAKAAALMGEAASALKNSAGSSGGTAPINTSNSPTIPR